MNQLPCNSLYCVPGRLVQLIWFYNTIDGAQKAANDDFHRWTLIISPVSSLEPWLHNPEQTCSMKGPCSQNLIWIGAALCLSVDVMLCSGAVAVKTCLI